MKITRRKLTEMIEQEVRARLAGISEADRSEKGPAKKPKKPETASADDASVEPSPDGGGPDPITTAPPIDGGMRDDDADGKPDPGSVDPTDGEGEDDEEALDPEGDAGEEPSGAVNDFISGKTVQSMTIEPKSKVLPGAKEIVLTFNETTEPVRIMVTATGNVKFFSQGQLHDIP
jgi:hypothetical protein